MKNKQKKSSAKDTWNPRFLDTSHHFETVASLQVDFRAFDAWPPLEEYNRLLSYFCVRNLRHDMLTCIPSPPRPRRRRKAARHVQSPRSQGLSTPPSIPDGKTSEVPYEMQILEHGVIPTRLENWHDFCNMLTWCRFPKIKAVLNGLQARPPGVPRNRYQELLTLFDEGGVIRIFNAQEKTLRHFYPSTAPQKNLSFGHALLEADLCGFKNSDGFTLPIYLETSALQQHLSQGTLYPWIDDFVAHHIAEGHLTKLTKEKSTPLISPSTPPPSATSTQP